MKYEYTFLGGFIPLDELKTNFAKSRARFQVAANILQWRFINGIEAAFGHDMTLLTAPFLGSYPKNNRQLIVHSHSFSHNKITNDEIIGYLNLTAVKQILYKRSVNKKLKNYYNGRRENTVKVLFAYSTALIPEIIYIKKKHPELIICLIVPDLPNFTSLDLPNATLLHKYNLCRRKQFDKVVKENIIDHFVFLTSGMADELGISDDRYTVIEGIAETPDREQMLLNISRESEYRDIVYTGTLATRYGIIELIKSFKKITDERCRLIICGGGGGADAVREASSMDKRIKFMGLVDPNTAKQIQQNAAVLVNPRQNNEVYTKFSFPSKLMEYLATGHPVVCYKLDGIPDEYDEILNYAETDEDGLKRAIESALSMTDKEKCDYAMKVYNFLSEEKTAEKQCEKLYSNLRKLLFGINPQSKVGS